MKATPFPLPNPGTGDRRRSSRACDLLGDWPKTWHRQRPPLFMLPRHRPVCARLTKQIPVQNPADAGAGPDSANWRCRLPTVPRINGAWRACKGVNCIVGDTSVGKDRKQAASRHWTISGRQRRRLLDRDRFRWRWKPQRQYLEVPDPTRRTRCSTSASVHALRKIKELAPKERQTLFSARPMPKAIKELVMRHSATTPSGLPSPRKSTTAERIDQYLIHVQQTKSSACSK